MNNFKKGLSEWYDKAVGDQTWINFKTHFCLAQEKLRQIRGPTMRSGVLTQQANILSTKTMHEIKSERKQHLDTVYASKERLMKAFAVITPNSLSETVLPQSQPSAPSTNATTNDNVMLEVLQLLKELKNDNSRKQKNSGQQNSDNQKKQGYQDQNTSNKQTRFNISKYCYSHGACSHSSDNCKAKKQGHKDTVTFNKKMGGSTDFCQVCT